MREAETFRQIPYHWAMNILLVNAPHTADDLAAENWPHAYSRMEAVFPGGSVAAKYWPPVSRIDNVAGDRNLVCACPPIEALAS